jgi:hypothetical protein
MGKYTKLGHKQEFCLILLARDKVLVGKPKGKKPLRRPRRR